LIALEKAIEETLYSAKSGNKQNREKLLHASKPFILRVATKVCQRRLEWGSDDELSIGLIAMDEAINRYDLAKQIPFLAYARIVIKSRLMDFFRKESKHQSISLEDCKLSDGEYLQHTPAETAQAWENYINERAAKERQEEIREFGCYLAQFNLSYNELVQASPKHRDTRETLIKVAWDLATNENLIKQLIDKKRLPLAELTVLTGIKRKTLERGRRYIVALALLIYHREKFIYIYSYLRLVDRHKGGIQNSCR